MSESYNRKIHGNPETLSVWVSGENVDLAIDQLYGCSQRAYPAIGSALKRAAASGEAYAAKIIGKEYYISAKEFKNSTSVKKHVYNDHGCLSVGITFRGRHIPLLKFDTGIDKDGRVIARVKRASVRSALDHMFYQKVGNGHYGIFERISKERLPIRENFGPSTPQVMGYNEHVVDEISDRIHESFDKRLEHEVNAILNGRRLKKDGTIYK